MRKPSRIGVHAAVAAIAATAGLGVVGVAGASKSAAEHVLTAPAATGGWSPQNNITIQTGDSVRWTFPEGFHNVRSEDTDTAWNPPIPPNDVIGDHPDVTYEFTAEGVYAFYCEAHPGAMDGKITVQDEPVDPTPTPTPTQTATPTPTPIPQPGGTNPTTPPPTPGADSVKPRVRSVSAKALRRAVRVKFRLSEPATVTVRVKRGRRVVKSKRVQAGAGTHTVTVRSKKLKKGRYTIEILARDASGNRSKLATKRLTLRR
jgi:plastocyanin